MTDIGFFGTCLATGLVIGSVASLVNITILLFFNLFEK